MPIGEPEDIDRLEAELVLGPDSEELREALVEAYAGTPDLLVHPRRFEHLRWFIRNRPDHSACRTPFACVDPGRAPEAYAELEAEWLARAAAAPADASIARGAANFLQARDIDAAKELLYAAARLEPGSADLWMDLGRMSADPAEQLACFERARSLGATLPNLLVWIATSAARAGEEAKARAAAEELLALVDAARAQHGEALDWPEQDGGLWEKALDATGSKRAARELVFAIAHHAYRKHWAHTVLGLLACRRRDLDEAVTHLHASADVRPDFRLSAYGPSLDLVSALCAEGRWSDVAPFLRVVEQHWKEARAPRWLAQVERQELPTLREPDEEATSPDADLPGA